MHITASDIDPAQIDADAIITPVFEGDDPREGSLQELNNLSGGKVASLFERGEIAGKRDRWALLHIEDLALLFYGAGKMESSSLSLQRMAGGAARALVARGMKSVAFLIDERIDPHLQARAVIEGAAMGQMETNLYANDRREREIERFILASKQSFAFDDAIREGAAMAEAANLARRLSYEPGNVMTPSEMSRRAEEMALREGLSFESFDEAEIKRMGMGALAAVSRGSDESARLIVMGYNLDDQTDTELTALVGKGITFDSGGISIKPASNMDEMKYDMGGGAAVIGAMQAIARLRPRARVLGVIPAAENLPSGRAVKPGDVVRSLSGKTIEVANTDAEGRLVLADAITYAANRGATRIIDVATLTGACVIALGEARAGIMGTDQGLIDALIRAGERTGERLWQLPADNEYGEMIRSDIADIKNTGNRFAGAITAGMFIKNFAGRLPWAHLDIAGTAWLEQEKPHLARGATGFGARLLADFIINP
ncbi:MAG: leucyl aminopeptidase [Acidobacteriota bacterium]